MRTGFRGIRSELMLDLPEVLGSAGSALTAIGADPARQRRPRDPGDGPALTAAAQQAQGS
ncbi:hypothetical protein RMN57_06130 [Kitasatospora sp. CM 4170]|uniref:Uncharacterized protein n=1 Tax=Kitasatospora aburaviensis TaxID=67265 RepID=A0ABW1F0R0_9ACTN|nr:hypothetical protein [Kitasatospora sp. CM 4170]WNM44314.1 hypothetical protein RMN57_06130 [Kitasatospora sp. CM 4170]